MATPDETYDEEFSGDDFFEEDSFEEDSVDFEAGSEEGVPVFGEGESADDVESASFDDLVASEPLEAEPSEERAKPEAQWPYGTKRNLILTSLVAAIPGAVLAFLMVRTFLSYAEKMNNVPLMAFAGLTLVASATLVLMPFGVWVFGPKELKPAARPKDEPAEEEAAERGMEEQAVRAEPEGFGDVIPEDFDASSAGPETDSSEIEAFDVDDDFATEAESSEEFVFDEDVFADDE